jgi:hypothetical protein
MCDLHRLAGHQAVGRAVAVDLDGEPARAHAHPELDPVEPFGQTRGEADLAVVVAHSAEPGHHAVPRARQ